MAFQKETGPHHTLCYILCLYMAKDVSLPDQFLSHTRSAGFYPSSYFAGQTPRTRSASHCGYLLQWREPRKSQMLTASWSPMVTLHNLGVMPMVCPTASSIPAPPAARIRCTITLAHSFLLWQDRPELNFSIETGKQRLCFSPVTEFSPGSHMSTAASNMDIQNGSSCWQSMDVQNLI